MSNLSVAISRLLEKKAVTAAQLSRLTGIDHATISRWINGQQLSMSDSALRSVAEALSRDPAEQAEIVAARMLDLRYGPGSELITLQIGEKPFQQSETKLPLPPRIERAFRTIAKYAEMSAVRDIILSIEELLEPATSKEPEIRYSQKREHASALNEEKPLQKPKPTRARKGPRIEVG